MLSFKIKILTSGGEKNLSIIRMMEKVTNRDFNMRMEREIGKMKTVYWANFAV
jgi:hypothetical protein